MDVKGLTLRTKPRRPQISAPRPLDDPNASSTRPSQPSVPAPQPTRQPQNVATSDLVKRRYSTRYNQMPMLDGNIPAVPTLSDSFGTLATALSQEFANGGDFSTSNRAQPLQLDAAVLRDPKLSVEQYVTTLLSNASEQEIRDYQERLRKLKNRTSTDLQQNVYQNRTQFIKISKEAEKLKEEMSTLRTLMSELTTALGQTSTSNGSGALVADDTAISPASTRRHAGRRTSVMNLENMWNVQLQAMWKAIEGSQKFLPAIPGRHIVLESGQWVELDSATWKPRRPVHIVLLNDHLLVAAKKRKRIDPNSAQAAKGPVPTKLVAEECWPLQDIDMIDLGARTADEYEDRAVPNAINIRYGPKSFTYRHAQRDNVVKNDLLLTFRKTAEGLRKLLWTESETAASREGDTVERQSLARESFPDKFSRSDSPHRDKLDVLIDVDGKQQNFRWVEGQLDELDIEIALQHFEESVSRVERLRKLARSLKANQTAQQVILRRVEQRASKLAEVLLRSLLDTHSFLLATRFKVAWLSRLGFDDKARETYLNTRAEVIDKRIRQCVFEGNLPLYIFQLSFVYFTVIKNTISIYQQCFPAPMTSSCIKWAKERLDEFNAILARQLSSVEPNTTVWQRCMEIVSEHASSLSEVGVDFRDMIPRDLGARDAASLASSQVQSRIASWT